MANETAFKVYSTGETVMGSGLKIVPSHNHDNKYYTQTESDEKYCTKIEAREANDKHLALASVVEDAANAFKGTQSGTIIRCDDVSPIEHTVTCKARSKNMFDSSMLLLASGWTESNGVYSGNTKSLFEKFGSATTNKLVIMQFKPKTQYALSFKGYTSGDQTHGARLFFEYDDGTKSGVEVTTQTETAYTLVSTVGKTVTRIFASYYYDNVITYLSEVQLEEGTEATAYIPYVNPTTVKVTRCGKNLAYPCMYKGKVGGYTYTPNEDGSLTISGAATTTSEHVIPLALKDAESNTIGVTLKANETYTLSVTKDGEAFTSYGVKLLLANGTAKWSFEQRTTKDRELQLIYIQFTPSVGDTAYCGTYRVQLELADAPTNYTPYIGKTYTPNTDGTVDGIKSVTPTMILTPNASDVSIECEYNRDINGVIATYDNTIAELKSRIDELSATLEALTSTAS